MGQNGSPDPIGAVTYVVRDAAGIPVANSMVTLGFSNCADVRLAGDVTSPNVILNCAAKTLSAFTGSDGAVTLRIVGSGTGTPRTLANCVSVTVDGVPLPPPTVAAFDLDGLNGVSLADLCIAYADVISGQYRPRCDYDFDGDIDMSDLSIMARVMFAGDSKGSGTACP